MDVKLDSLIEKIKKEGIDEAQHQADEIIAAAKKQANGIVTEAKKEATKLIDDGKQQVDQYQATAEVDLKQAARNIELLLKEKITSLFDNVFKKQAATAMKPEFLKELILKIVSSWTKDAKAEVIINEGDKDQLEKLLFSSLKKDLKDSINLKLSHDIATGFRIGIKGDEVYYDFSDESIADILKTLINPKLKQILDISNG